MNDDTPTRTAVFDALRANAPRALHLAEICGRIGVEKSRRDEVLDLLDELVRLGLAKEMPGLRFRASRRGAARAPNERAPAERSPAGRAPAPPKRAELVGRLTVNPRGFGFVAAEDGGVDVFVPAEHLGGAMMGDRVRVHARPSPKGREGEIVEVLARGRTLLGGTLRRARRAHFVEPDDPRVPGPYPVEGELPADVHAGHRVVVEIAQYPRLADEPPRVRVVGLLGEPGEIRAEVRALELRHAVVEAFPPDVIEEAREVPMALSPADLEGREDLRHLDLVTIDPVDARDHDDAVWGERLPDGGYRVFVAIADVSHYVRPGTAIDREAFARGTSIYLPDRAIPMLPPQISSTMASLVPGEDRLTLGVEAELGPRGAIVRHRFFAGVMRSPARLDYGGVARALGLSDAPARSEEAEARRPTLEVLFELSRKLKGRRARRGALDFDLPEAKVLLDSTSGAPSDVVEQKGDPGVRQAYSLIEELMLLANEIVAAELGRRGVPTIYRVHGEPDEERLERFAALATSLGHPIDVEDAKDPRKLGQFLRKVARSPRAGALNYLLLRSMQQATYDVTNVGHFGLAARDYLHFTSPIRRYPDLVVHRIVKEVLAGRPDASPEREQALRTQAAESSRNERRANDLERDVVDLYRVFLMRDRVGEEFDATVSGVADHGFYARLDSPFVDALVPVERLDDDFYELDELGLRLVGRRTGRSWGLGDRVRIRLEEASLERRELVATPASGARRATGRRPAVAAADDEALDDVDLQYLDGGDDGDDDAEAWPARAPGRGAPGRLSPRGRGRAGAGRPGARSTADGGRRGGGRRDEDDRGPRREGKAGKPGAKGAPGKGGKARASGKAGGGGGAGGARKGSATKGRAAGGGKAKGKKARPKGKKR